MGLILDGPQPLIPSANSGLPSGGSDKDVLTSDALGAGQWSTPDDVVGGALTTILGGEPAGTAIVSDGAGDATLRVVAAHTSGTLAARPASPGAGDTYAVTSGTATGARYVCHVAGSWEASVMPLLVGHSYDRLSPSAAGGGARFLDSDSLQAYTSTGDDTVGWAVELANGLGSDRAGLTHNAATAISASTSLSGLAINTMTVATVFDWIGPGSGYAALFGIGNRSTGSLEVFIRRVGSDDLLVVYNYGAVTPETTLTTFVGGLAAGIHRLCIAPITGNKYRWSFDGSAVTDTAMASTWAALPSSAPVGFGTSAVPDSPLLGRSIDVGVWASLLSSGDILALATAPGTETYRLAPSSSTGAARIRVEANRYDPSLPLVLVARGITSVLTVGSAARKYSYP